jgi:hypothetical protein
MNNNKNDVLYEIVKATGIIKEKTGINRSEFDKYPSEYLMKIYSLLKKCNFEIDWTHEHPDFIITAPDKFYIEAVTSNKRFNKEHDYRHDRGGAWEITKGYKEPEDYNF